MGYGVFVIANREKESISADTFKTTLEEKEFNVIDANSKLSSVSQINQLYLAIESDYNYQIEFYELTDEESAKTVYDNNKNKFEETKGDTSACTSVDGKNWSKYTLTSDGKYMVVSRVANTIVYLSVKDQYSDEIKDILKEIGY